MDERREAISREHAAIGRAIGEIESELDWLKEHPLECGEPWDLRVIVESFRDHLVHHFEFEEHDGPLDVELLHDPYLASEAGALVAEHRVLRDRLEHVLDKLEPTCPHRVQLEPLDRELRAVITDLRVHEATETRLMLKL
jgi:hypothetical protein